MHGGNERSDTCTALFVLTLAKTRLRLSNQKGWANYPDGSRQLSNITKLAIVGHTISPPSVLPLRGSRAAVQYYRHLLGWKRASSLKERSAGAGNRLPHSDSPPAVRRNRKSAHSGGETRYKCLSSLSRNFGLCLEHSFHATQFCHARSAPRAFSLSAARRQSHNERTSISLFSSSFVVSAHTR